MTYFAQKQTPEIDPHNHKATCGSLDRSGYSTAVFAKLAKVEAKIASMKAAQTDASEIEALYLSVKTKANELRFSTQLGWLKLKKGIEHGFNEIVLKHNKSKLTNTQPPPTDAVV